MSKKYKVGLTLSGGGAKGAAHIGVLKALEERGIKVDVISGTSAGSIVGSLFANGYTSDEILEFYLSTTIFRPGYYTWKKPGLLNTDALGELLVPLFSEDSFESLKIPMHIVATNIEEAKERVFYKGQLIKAILASSSFPGVFAPVEVEGKLYADGGILNNFPVDLIRKDCDVLIGVNVQNVEDIDKRKLKTTFSLIQRVITISTRSNSLKKYKECDVLISPAKLSSYATFNMYKMKKMYSIGYAEASKTLDQYLSKEKSIQKV